MNRTTTFPIETIFRAGDYAAVVTFLSEHETRFEIEESVSSAIIRGATDDRERTAKDFLEQSDMRFRLKYILGDYQPETNDVTRTTTKNRTNSPWTKARERTTRK